MGAEGRALRGGRPRDLEHLDAGKTATVHAALVGDAKGAQVHVVAPQTLFR